MCYIPWVHMNHSNLVYLGWGSAILNSQRVTMLYDIQEVHLDIQEVHLNGLYKHNIHSNSTQFSHLCISNSIRIQYAGKAKKKKKKKNPKPKSIFVQQSLFRRDTKAVFFLFLLNYCTCVLSKQCICVKELRKQADLSSRKFHLMI